MTTIVQTKVPVIFITDEGLHQSMTNAFSKMSIGKQKAYKRANKKINDYFSSLQRYVGAIETLNTEAEKEFFAQTLPRFKQRNTKQYAFD